MRRSPLCPVSTDRPHGRTGPTRTRYSKLARQAPVITRIPSGKRRLERVVPSPSSINPQGIRLSERQAQNRSPADESATGVAAAIPVVAESATVGKRRVDTGRGVRITKTVTEREEVIAGQRLRGRARRAVVALRETIRAAEAELRKPGFV